jgi:zinc transport system permease protein
MLDIFQYEFMIRAFIAGIAIAVTAPLIGNFLVAKRFSLIADTLSHISLTGVALGLLTHTSPLAAAVLVTIVASVFIERLRVDKNISADAVLAMFLPGGLALSVILISLANGFNANLFSYLFGSISTVQTNDLWLIVTLAILTLSLVVFLYHQLFYTVFDEESATVKGINVGLMNALLVILTAITVSLAMRVVGALLVGALMVIPVTTSTQLARSFKQTLIMSVIFALASVILGLYLAFYFNLPAGGTIVLLALAFFASASLLPRLK